MTSLPIRHLISIDDLSEAQVESILGRTDEIMAEGQKWGDALRERIVALVFLEPSTRTFLSFQSAVQRLGGSVISNSLLSVTKGETLEDTIRVVSAYADLLVLRHAKSNTRELADGFSSIPLINGGDDSNEHPTQALIDLFTIRQRVGRLENVTVGVGFDPLHSRSIKSFLRAIGRFRGNRVISVAPPEFQITPADVARMNELGLVVETTSELEALRSCDVLYVNRFQVERHSAELRELDFQTLGKEYRLVPELISGSSVRAILDPLPRVHELDDKVDEMVEAAYFDQARNGVAVRMAVLEQMIRN